MAPPRKPKPLKSGFKLVFMTILGILLLIVGILLYLGSYAALTPTHQKLADTLLDCLKVNLGIIFGLLGGYLSDK